MLPSDQVRSRDIELDANNTEFDAIVVGAGMTGLAAADRLSSAGRRVLLVEASAQAGGLLRSVPVGDGTAAVEAYYHHIFPQDRELRELIDRLGLRDRLEWRRGRTAVVASGRVHDFDTPMDLLRFRAVSPYARVRLAAGSGVFAIAGSRRYDRWRIGDAGPRVFGRRGFDALWRPLLDGKFGEMSGDVASAWLRARIRQRMGARRANGDRLGYLRGGFGQLVDGYVRQISARADLRFGLPVRRIERVSEGWRVGFGDQEATARAVIVCLAGHLLGELTELPAEYRRQIDGIPHRAAVCALLELDRPLGSHYWYNLTDATELGCLAVIEHTNYVPADWYGTHLLYLAHYVRPDAPAVTATDAEMLRAAEPALRSINPAFDPTWVRRIRVMRDRFAQPVPLAGGPMPALPMATGLPGLFHASMAHIYPDDRGVSLALRLGAKVGEAAGAVLTAAAPRRLRA